MGDQHTRRQLFAVVGAVAASGAGFLAALAPTLAPQGRADLPTEHTIMDPFDPEPEPEAVDGDL
jgi:hypothetical protein